MKPPGSSGDALVEKISRVCALAHGRVFASCLEWRHGWLAQAGRETEDAVWQLEHELDTPDHAVMRLATRQALGD